MIISSLGQIAPDIQMPSNDVGDATQAKLMTLTNAWGGGHVYFKGEDGRCGGWSRIQGRGQYWTGKGVVWVTIPSHLACSLAKSVEASRFTPVDAVIRNRGWQAQVRLEKPWMLPLQNVPNVLRRAFFRPLY